MSKSIKTKVKMPELDVINADAIDRDSQHELHITTNGGGGKVSTSAIVGRSGEGFFTFIMFGDYREILLNERKRATKKAIETQHAEALEQIESVKADAIAYYQGKVKDVA